MLDRIIRHDLLGSYAQVAGVERALRRLSTYLDSRWQKQFALDRSVRDLVAHEVAFAADFHEFFPTLQAHVAELKSSSSAPETARLAARTLHLAPATCRP